MDYIVTESEKPLSKEVNLGIRSSMKPFDMELESKNSVSGVRKVIVLFGIIFCTIVTLLLIVLYYPSSSEEKEFDNDFKKMVSVGSSRDWGITNEDASKTRVEDVARALEDFENIEFSVSRHQEEQQA
ncbi:hypothetical protein HNY73_007896 [Argiope bruennichi]|uniref:Uncharacterized protein n=1 Tax=Argiope bruennichi TaxID=94029 RepID=A0A8T0F4K4_ARGBR|nr:hypothetical protein HNY73_007896 [Argiope bruennichi]